MLFRWGGEDYFITHSKTHLGYFYRKDALKDLEQKGQTQLKEKISALDAESRSAVTKTFNGLKHRSQIDQALRLAKLKG